MKKLLLVVISIFAQLGFAQNPQLRTPEPVVVKGPVKMESLSENWEKLKADSEIRDQNEAYLLVQFQSLPNLEEKKILAEQGVELLAYIPNSTWLAKIDVNLPVDVLENYRIQFLGKLDPSIKMPEDMRRGEVPYFAGTAESTVANILFWNGSNLIYASSICENVGLDIIGIHEKWNRIEVRGNLNALKLLSKHPLVQYIAWPEPPIENENRVELTQIQSNYISNNPASGLYFDGTGVTIAINEGGTIDSIDSPDYKGRLDRGLESGGVSGHKTSVAIRMAGAGNIDPFSRGTAFGANIQSGGINFSNAATTGVSIVNNSYGYGCISGTSTYDFGAQENDNLVRTNPSFMISYSAGNEGNTDCGYGAGAGWGTITGLRKSAKNIFAVGAVNNDGLVTGFSSRGPAWDGRILPDICATGPGGTSHASPNLVGTYAQLVQAYRSHNSGSNPPSGLVKAIMLNSADELENPGPDFISGYGKLNARRAYEIIRLGQHFTASISNGGSNSHSITVPANVQELKVMVYWTDYEATAGIVGKALVNDLNMVLVDPGLVQWLPWVLNPAPNATTLSQNAVRAVDTLNNVEQVTLANPAAGNYLLNVAGTTIPQGPQQYFVVYEFVMDELVMTYPNGDEHFLPNSSERIRWESLGGSGNFQVEFSADTGATWTVLASNLASNTRFLDWVVPDTVTNQARIRVSRGSKIGMSQSNFHILERPAFLNLEWSCADSSLFTWDSVAGAAGYIVYRLGINYMDSVAFTMNPQILLHNFSQTETEYVAVATLKNNAISSRTVAISRPPTNLNCVNHDVGMLTWQSPGARYIPSCLAPPLVVKIKNIGTNSVTLIPFGYRIDGGAVLRDTASVALASAATANITLLSSISLSLGNHILEAWTEFPGDGNFSNDTIQDSLIVFSGASASLQLSENFDSFSNCSTAWGCESITCSLANGWFNIPNVYGGDVIDWRSHNGATATGSTGPSGDHTSGSGKYLYLEGSGNNGAGCLNSKALLYSPCIDLIGLSQVTCSFWYHAYGSGIGELHLDVIADGQLFEDVTAPISGNQGDQWFQKIVDLSRFGGTQIVLVFRGITGSGFTTDLAIDDIAIQAMPGAQFYADTLVCISDTVQLFNTSVLANTSSWSISPSSFAFQNGTNANSVQPAISFSSPGLYTIQLTTTNTYGSTNNLKNDYIQVVGTTTSTISTSACESYLSPSGNYIWTQSNTYFDTISNFAGCDSVITVQLTIDTLNLSLISNANTISAVQGNANYQWLDCNNNFVAIAGETFQSFSPSASGNFACMISNGSCVDTSACMPLTTVALDEEIISQVQLFPNPTNGQIILHFPSIVESAKVLVSDVSGKKVLERKFWDISEAELVLNASAGFYFVEVNVNGLKKVFKLRKDQ